MIAKLGVLLCFIAGLLYTPQLLGPQLLLKGAARLRAGSSKARRAFLEQSQNAFAVIEKLWRPSLLTPTVTPTLLSVLGVLLWVSLFALVIGIANGTWWLIVPAATIALLTTAFGAVSFTWFVVALLLLLGAAVRLFSQRVPPARLSLVAVVRSRLASASVWTRFALLISLEVLYVSMYVYVILRGWAGLMAGAAWCFQTLGLRLRQRTMLRTANGVALTCYLIGNLLQLIG